MLKVPTTCPVCGNKTHVAVVKCDSCGTTVNNNFDFTPFESLSNNQIEFVLSFIECEGSIKEMEKRFDISYPTVKSRLSEIKKVLGLAESVKSYKMSVIDDIANGAIDVNSAIELLKKGE